LIKDGTATVTLNETGGDNFNGGILVLNGTLILDNTNSAIGGGVSITSIGTLQIGNNDGNGALPSGNVAVDGRLLFKRNTEVSFHENQSQHFLDDRPRGAAIPADVVEQVPRKAVYRLADQPRLG